MWHFQANKTPVSVVDSLSPVFGLKDTAVKMRQMTYIIGLFLHLV